MNQQLKPEDLIALVNHHDCRRVPSVDPRRVQLLVLFDQCDERGKHALLSCGAFHARYPQEEA